MTSNALRDLATSIAGLLDLLARNVPELAAECVPFADRLRAWATRPIAEAGPTDPPPPPPHG